MGEGVYAYCIEYRMTMTMLLSWSLSLVSLCHVFAMSLTATCSHLPVQLFVVLTNLATQQITTAQLTTTCKADSKRQMIASTQ